MAKANPKAWFTNSIAKITYKSVDRIARVHEKWRPFFPTWKEAHTWMLTSATERLKRAEREAASARRFLDTVKAMKEPT